jgi:hypothetical protein
VGEQRRVCGQCGSLLCAWQLEFLDAAGQVKVIDCKGTVAEEEKSRCIEKILLFFFRCG